MQDTSTLRFSVFIIGVILTLVSALVAIQFGPIALVGVFAGIFLIARASHYRKTAANDRDAADLRIRTFGSRLVLVALFGFFVSYGSFLVFQGQLTQRLFMGSLIFLLATIPILLVVGIACQAWRMLKKDKGTDA